MSHYLTTEQIEMMAECAVDSYEMTGCWDNAYCMAAEYAVDEFGIHPRQSAVQLATKLARTKWLARSMAVAAAVR